jgi:5-methylcytosine-specific restriction endonuclease McrA
MTYSTKRPNNRKVSSDPAVRRRVKLRSKKMCAAIRIYETFDMPIKCRSKSELRIDHIRELRWGGLDIESNLQALCKTCHKQKTAANIKYQNTWRVIWFK